MVFSLFQTVRLGLLTPMRPAYFCLMAALSSPMPLLANLTVPSLLVLLLTVEGLLPVEAVVVPVLLVVLPVLAVDEVVFVAA